jgi:hypothetical protein
MYIGLGAGIDIATVNVIMKTGREHTHTWDVVVGADSLL